MNSQLTKHNPTTKFNRLEAFFASPAINALCQLNPISSAISAYIGGVYANEQNKVLEDFLHKLNDKVQSLQREKIDKDFLDSKEGKRVIVKILRNVWRDNRIEKIQAMATLTANIYIKSKLSIDERELYVDILDGLNSLQLSILQRAVSDMRTRTVNKHRGFGWELLAKDYEQKGVSKPLLLQSIKTLESNGLLNKNDATIVEKDKTHFITDFGEQFYDFISEQLKEGSPYL
jgi:DNA replication initiation complex subunit (GINS family)